MDFGSPRGWGKVVGEDTLWVVLAWKEAVLVQCSLPITDTRLRHEPPPQEGSDSFTKRIQQEGAGDPHVTPCLRESLQHIFFNFFFSPHRGEGEQMQTVSPTKRKCY